MITDASLASKADRYDELKEEYSAHLFDSSGPATKYCDLVKPKSRGADFGYLISQAKSERESSAFPSFDDVLPDFCQGMDAMLSVKGEHILSWTGGDNFLVDDETSSNQEAPFLSLNLHSLAEQLSKVDLAKCLSVEADLLPPELCVPPSGLQRSPLNVTAQNSEEVACKGAGDRVVRNQNHETGTLHSTSNTVLHPCSTRVVRKPVEISGNKKIDVFEYLNSMRECQRNNQAEKNSNLFTIEAGSAEAELDMLLDTFGGPKLVDSFSVHKNADVAGTSKQHERDMMAKEEDYAGDQNISRITFSPALHDNIDGLLEETSIQDDLFRSSVVKPLAAHDPFSSSSHPNPAVKSEVLENFDSWLDTL